MSAWVFVTLQSRPITRITAVTTWPVFWVVPKRKPSTEYRDLVLLPCFGSNWSNWTQQNVVDCSFSNLAGHWNRVHSGLFLIILAHVYDYELFCWECKNASCVNDPLVLHQMEYSLPSLYYIPSTLERKWHIITGQTLNCTKPSTLLESNVSKATK